MKIVASVNKRVVTAADRLSTTQRIESAKNSKDSEELSELAHDPVTMVRYEVLKNSYTPNNILQMLCNEFWDDDQPLFRNAVAKRTDDLEILSELANDEVWYVRKSVAERTDDPEILTELLDEYEDVRVRDAAKKRLIGLGLSV